MSARPREVYEQTTNFSLRDVVTPAYPVAQKIPVQSSGGLFRMKPQPQEQRSAPSTVSMKLNFGSGFQVKQTAAETPSPAKPEQRPNLSFSFGMPAAKLPGHQRAMKLVPQTQAQGAPIQQASRQDDTDRQEIMRLTAYVEELNGRLKKAHLSLQQTEANMQHAQKVLQGERHAASKQTEAFKKELATAHETEAKLRAELSSRPQRSALSQSAFSQAVGSILADEQRIELHSREVQELESKIKALGDAKVLIEAEVSGIQKLRDQANAELETLRAQQTEMRASADESQRLVKIAEEALQTIEARKKLATEEVRTAELRHEGIIKDQQVVIGKISEARNTLEALTAQLESVRSQTTDAEALETAARSAAANAANEALKATQTADSCNEKTSAVKMEMEAASTKAESLRTELAELEDLKLQAQRDLASVRVSTASEHAAARETSAQMQAVIDGLKAKVEEQKRELADAKGAMSAQPCPTRNLIDDVPDFVLDNDDLPATAEPQLVSTSTLLDAPLPPAVDTTQSTVHVTADGPPRRVRPAGKIVGDIATTLPGNGGTAFLRRVAGMALSSRPSIAAELGMPISLAQHNIDAAPAGSAQKDATTLMVEAVIGDLKQALTDITQRQLPPSRMVMAI